MIVRLVEVNRLKILYKHRYESQNKNDAENDFLIVRSSVFKFIIDLGKEISTRNKIERLNYRAVCTNNKRHYLDGGRSDEQFPVGVKEHLISNT